MPTPPKTLAELRCTVFACTEELLIEMTFFVGDVSFRLSRRHSRKKLNRDARFTRHEKISFAETNVRSIAWNVWRSSLDENVSLGTLQIAMYENVHVVVRSLMSGDFVCWGFCLFPRDEESDFDRTLARCRTCCRRRRRWMRMSLIVKVEDVHTRLQMQLRRREPRCTVIIFFSWE